MKRAELEHLIRAAGAVSGSRRLIVIGSQSILAQYPTGAPARAVLSREADFFPLDAPDSSDVISVVLGELSPFDATFGYYADGVGDETARLPAGWRDRLVTIDNPNTNGYVGLCLEVHDLLISKYFAGRDKDHEFCGAVVGAGLVDHDRLMQRLADTDMDDEIRQRVVGRIAADFESRQD